MCELLGMECNVPTDIVFSFAGLAARGGRRGPHADGWGLALYDGPAARFFHETDPASSSALVEYVRTHPIKTLLAVAHVRKRTQGPTSLANTHPFVRELWGRTFVFAHNGNLRGMRGLVTRGPYRPVGTTDSERAFCWTMNELSRRFPDGPPADRRRYFAAVAELGAEMGRRGSYNFLLADGTFLFARCATKLAYLIRKAPFRKATLADEDLSVDFAEVTTTRDRVAVVATAPLTVDEQWTLGKPGTLWVFRRGRLAAELASA